MDSHLFSVCSASTLVICHWLAELILVAVSANLLFDL